jgi:hypothetical protein
MSDYKILGYDAYMMKRKYSNGRLALEFLDPEDGCPIVMATVNLPDADIADDEVAIKDYSENAGILQELMDQGVVSAPLRYKNSGFVRIPICKVLV